MDKPDLSEILIVIVVLVAGMWIGGTSSNPSGASNKIVDTPPSCPTSADECGCGRSCECCADELSAKRKK